MHMHTCKFTSSDQKLNPRFIEFVSDKWHIYSSEGSDISLELRAQLILHPHSVWMPPDGSNSLRHTCMKGQRTEKKNIGKQGLIKESIDHSNS